MYIIFLIMYLLVAVSLVLLIMLQHVKGTGIGGNSFNVKNLLSGVRANSSSDLVTRLTAIFGVLFFLFSLLLGNISNRQQYDRKDDLNNHILLKPELESMGTTDIEKVNSNK